MWGDWRLSSLLPLKCRREPQPTFRPLRVTAPWALKAVGDGAGRGLGVRTTKEGPRGAAAVTEGRPRGPGVRKVERGRQGQWKGGEVAVKAGERSIGEDGEGRLEGQSGTRGSGRPGEGPLVWLVRSFSGQEYGGRFDGGGDLASAGAAESRASSTSTSTSTSSSTRRRRLPFGRRPMKPSNESSSRSSSSSSSSSGAAAPGSSSSLKRGAGGGEGGGAAREKPHPGIGGRGPLGGTVASPSTCSRSVE